MATTIVTKNSSTASAVPTAGQLVQGELAVNVADKKLYTEDNAGSIIVLADGVKLAGIEALADVTDTANVTAAGALMDSELTNITAVKALNQGVATTDSPTFAGATLTTADINAGTIDGTVIGGSTAAAGTFTTGQFNTSLNVDGTVTADKLITDSNVDAASFTSASSTYVDINNGTVTGRLQTISSDFFIGTATVGTSLAFKSGNNVERLRISSGGDISFYEDTGTTAKLFWDASAESLGIGTSSPDTQLTLYKASTNADVNYAKMRMDSWGGSTGKLKSIVWDDAGSSVAGIGAEYDGAKTNIHFHSQYNGGFKGTADRTMSIMGDGNVGIGTAAPESIVHIKDTGNVTTTLQIEGAATGYAPTINFDGIVGASADYLLGEINGSWDTHTNVVSAIRFESGADTTNKDDGLISFWTSSSGPTLAERMRIDASGNLLVGTTSTPSATQAGFMLTGDQLYTSAGASTTTNYQVRFYNGNGLVGAITTDGSATAYLTSSDQRLKENITDANDAGDKIDAIQVRQYDWKADGSHQDYGMVAQELQLVAPEAVSGDADSEEMMGVDYSKLVPMLIKEIQSLRNRVAQLEA